MKLSNTDEESAGPSFTVGIHGQRSWTQYCFAPRIGDPALASL